MKATIIRVGRHLGLLICLMAGAAWLTACEEPPPKSTYTETDLAEPETPPEKPMTPA